MIEELAQALHEQQQSTQEEHLQQSIKNLDKKLEHVPQAKPRRFDTYADIARHGYFGVEKQPTGILQNEDAANDVESIQQQWPQSPVQHEVAPAVQYARVNHLQPQPPSVTPKEDNPLLKHPKELSYVDKKMIKNEKLSATWLQISKHGLNQEYQRAYEMSLTQADDIYLLRLIM